MKRLKQYIGLVFLLFLFVGCSKNEQSGTNQTTKET